MGPFKLAATDVGGCVGQISACLSRTLSYLPRCTPHPPGQPDFKSTEDIEGGDQGGAEAFEEEEFARGSLPEHL